VGSAGSDVTQTIDCVKEDGTTVVLAPSSNFKGTLAVTYAFQEEVPDAPERLAVATISGPVVEE
jgi:hypothetical protein